MNDQTLPLVTFLLAWWMVVFCVYAALLVGVDALLVAYQVRRTARRWRRDEDRRIAANTAAAVERIGTAFTSAQQLLRSEAALSRGARR